MKVDSRLPWRDVGGLPFLLWRSIGDHRRAQAPLHDFRLQASWKEGPAPAGREPLLVSFTQFTPHRLRDMGSIWLAAEALGQELVAMPEAHGVVTYFQPGGRCVGSLSAWTEEAGLRRFVSLPSHLKVVRKFRDRGEALRSTKWWVENFQLGAALAEGQRRIDGAQPTD